MLQYLIIFVVFLVVVYILSWFFNGSKNLSTFSDASKALVIPATSLPPGTSVNYTYSIWIYIDDWTKNYGQEKIIFMRGNGTSLLIPKVYLGEIENTLNVSMTMDPIPSSSTAPNVFHTMISNVPLQKWTNLIVSLNTKSLDIYMNGKLVRTSILPNIPKQDATAPLTLTPGGGFSGFTSRFYYKNDSITPQDAWNIYRSGPGGNIFSNFLNQYKIQLNFLKGEDVKASLTI
jgi:hypothetical protein